MTDHPRIQNEPHQAPYFYLTDRSGSRCEYADLFLRDVFARRPVPNTVRTYAYALLDWYRYLATIDVDIVGVQRSHVADYVIQLRQKPNPQRRRCSKAPKAGSVNPVTRKASLPPGYRPSTINQRLTVVGMFYDVLALNQQGPGVHPISPSRHQRAYNPSGRAYRYKGVPTFRQRLEQRYCRPIPRQLHDKFREAVASTRDGALLEGLYCTAGRASEILGLTEDDVMWDEQMVLLHTKGFLGKEPVVVSLRFLELLRRYLDERGPSELPDKPIWLTNRKPQRPLNYSALRAMLRRLNEQFSSNVTLHDFRATCATDMAANPDISILMIKNHLRHRAISSTFRYIDSSRMASGLMLIKHLNSMTFQKPIEFDLLNYKASSIEEISLIIDGDL